MSAGSFYGLQECNVCTCNAMVQKLHSFILSVIYSKNMNYNLEKSRSSDRFIQMVC